MRRNVSSLGHSCRAITIGVMWAEANAAHTERQEETLSVHAYGMHADPHRVSMHEHAWPLGSTELNMLITFRPGFRHAVHDGNVDRMDYVYPGRSCMHMHVHVHAQQLNQCHLQRQRGAATESAWHRRSAHACTGCACFVGCKS